VFGVGIGADEAGYLAGDADFFLDFADGGLGEGLADVDGAAGECPVAVVGALDEEDFAFVVFDDDVDGGDDGGCLGGVGVVVVVDASGAAS
jgi:hypothetical protein